MKNKILILSLVLTMFLMGCGTSYTITQVKFNNLDFQLKSSKSYTSRPINNNKYPGMMIYQEKSEKTTDTFINSLIITSKDNPNLSTKDFANQNIDNLKSNISSIKALSTNTLTFNCSGEKTVGIIKSFTITENKKDSYFSEFFLINDNKLYIISFQSDNQEDNLDFRNSLNSLKCIK